MALRVLLADESTTIKKAIQMALADLGVDVKSVPSGLDVLSVSRTFLPEIIFADVLLTKRNGYDVCAEIKNDPELKQTPVILMWSSFMQLDQTQYKRVKADASLEKPFDSEALRSLVEKFVKKATQFPLRGFLNHPELPDFEESDTFVRQRGDYVKQQKPSPNTAVNEPINARNNSSSGPQNSLSNSNDLSDEIDEFSEVPLKPKKKNQPDEWTSAPAEQFIVETESFGEFEEVTVTSALARSGNSPDLHRRIQEQLSTYMQDAPVAQSKSQKPSGKNISQLDEQIMKEEIRLMAEKICWQILPDITEKIVREELNKLLTGLEKI